MQTLPVLRDTRTTRLNVTISLNDSFAPLAAGGSHTSSANINKLITSQRLDRASPALTQPFFHNGPVKNQITSDGGGGEGSMRNDRKQPHFRSSHPERADRRVCHSHLPSRSSTYSLLFFRLSWADRLLRIFRRIFFRTRSSNCQNRKAGERGTSGKTGLEMTVKMMRRDSRPDRGDGPKRGPGVFQYLGQRQFTG